MQATKGRKGIFIPVHKVFSVQLFNYYIYGITIIYSLTQMLYRDINPQQIHQCFPPLLQILIMLTWGENAKNSLRNKHFMSTITCSTISLSVL